MMGFMKSIRNAIGQPSGQPSGGGGLKKFFRNSGGNSSGQGGSLFKRIGKMARTQDTQPTAMADGGYVSGKRVEKSYGKKK